MNKRMFFLVIALLGLFYGCEESGDQLNFDNISNISNTKWTLAKIIDNTTREVTNFPEELDSFNIIFKQDGTIELPGYCNFSYGYYELESPDSIHILSLGPSTKRYCLPDLFMEWEILFTHNLREAQTYFLHNNQLTIQCNSDYNLVFNFCEFYNYKGGRLLFYTNAHQINCPFEIEISINQAIIDTITAASSFVQGDCLCEDLLNIGILLNIAPGKYLYSARELACVATNRVNNWSDYIRVKEDSCTVVFLDISEKVDYQGGR